MGAPEEAAAAEAEALVDSLPADAVESLASLSVPEEAEALVDSYRAPAAAGESGGNGVLGGVGPADQALERLLTRVAR